MKSPSAFNARGFFVLSAYVVVISNKVRDLYTRYGLRVDFRLDKRVPRRDDN